MLHVHGGEKVYTGASEPRWVLGAAARTGSEARPRRSALGLGSCTGVGRCARALDKLATVDPSPIFVVTALLCFFTHAQRYRETLAAGWSTCRPMVLSALLNLVTSCPFRTRRRARIFNILALYMKEFHV